MIRPERRRKHAKTFAVGCDSDAKRPAVIRRNANA
jgi:hypothetical protein